MLYPNVEVRHLHAVIVLAEELNFTRAAIRLNICQPALSKQMAELEKGLGFPLFLRQRKKIIDLSEPGRVFVEEARSAVLHAERAVHMARSISHGSETVLTVGHSPFADRAWISTLLALRLPLYPKLRLRLKSRFATDLARGVISGELDLAIVTAPPNDPRITAAVFVRIPLYVALPESHRAALKKAVTLRDLDRDTWGLFSEQANPNAHDAIMRLAQREQIVPHEIHEVLGAPDAFHVVTEQNGIAFVSKATALSTHIDGVVFKPLSDESLSFDTCLVTRAETSRLINQFGMEFLKKYSRQSLSATQMSLGETA